MVIRKTIKVIHEPILHLAAAKWGGGDACKMPLDGLVQPMLKTATVIPYFSPNHIRKMLCKKKKAAVFRVHRVASNVT